MRALIRNEGETVRECDGLPGIDWTNGYPLTAPEWAGGPYTLVENYVEPVGGEEKAPAYDLVATSEATPADPQEEVVRINGKTYTKDEIEELRRSLSL